MKILIDIPDIHGALLLQQLRDEKFIQLCEYVSAPLALGVMAHVQAGDAEDHTVDVLISTVMMSFTQLARNATFTEVPTAPIHKDN